MRNSWPILVRINSPLTRHLFSMEHNRTHSKQWNFPPELINYRTTARIENETNKNPPNSRSNYRRFFATLFVDSNNETARHNNTPQFLEPENPSIWKGHKAKAKRFGDVYERDFPSVDFSRWTAGDEEVVSFHHALHFGEDSAFTTAHRNSQAAFLTSLGLKVQSSIDSNKKWNNFFNSFCYNSGIWVIT